MKKIYLLCALVLIFILSKSQTPVVMSSQAGFTYTENFNDIANWTFNGTTGTFSSGVGSAPWKGYAVTGGTGIPNPNVLTTQTTSFTTGSSGGVQKGAGVIQFLTTGTTANTTSLAFDFFMDFSGINAGTLSFNAATVFNSTGDRVGTLRVYASTDGVNWIQLTGTNLPYVATNNVSGSASISSIALPPSFNGSSSARLRFYYHNGDANGTTGSRPKISIDNLIVTATDSSNPSPSVSVSPSSLTGFSAIAGTPSASQSVSVSGSNLTDNITITPSSPYEISLDNSVFSSSLNLTQSGGTVNITTVYVRIGSSASPGQANGTIGLLSGTTTNSVSLSGTVIGLINLSTSPYVQNFNGIGAGLPAGITVKTGALSSSLGIDAAFATTAASWNNTTGGFKNFASGNNDQGVVQNTAVDRAIGVRQVAATDPGAAFVFQIANTTGKINFTLDFNLQSLDASSPRTTTWKVDYGFGVNPSSFTPAPTDVLTTGGNSFSNNPVHVNFGNALDDQPGIITIRIVTLTPSSGSGNRPSTGIDDFTLSWEDPTAKTISLSATALNFPTTNIGSSSSATYKIVSQTNLEQPIAITATPPYAISTDNINFLSDLSIAPADAFDKTIYVKFSPFAPGVYAGTITHSSEGTASKIITLLGEAVDPASLSFNFNTCTVSNIPGSAFLSINISGTQKWKCSQFGRNSTNGVDVNGFSGGAAQADDAWLISPALNLNGIVNLPVLSFYSRGEFTGPKLQLYVSTTYDGSSAPNLADWTELPANFPTPPGSATTTWTLSDNIDLSPYKIAPVVYIAFRYTSSPALNAARWSLDDVAIADQSTLLTVNPTELNFGEVSVGNNSPGQPVSFKAVGSNDVTVTPPAGYQVSTDNVSFSADAIVLDQATAEAGTTLYVRFSPTNKALKVEGNINVTADGLDKNVVALTGSSFPRSETFDAACYNISFFGSNSTNSASPAEIATQIANISTVMQHLNADVIGIEEMSNDDALAQLVANLPGYASAISNRWSHSFDPPDPTFPPQKIGFIYNTATMSLSTDEPPRVMFESMYDSARSNLAGHRLADYPTGTPSSFWASGRLPFIATFNTTINGVTQKIRVVVIHAKSGGDADGYTRRQYDVNVLKDSLDAFYANDRIMIVGDYNDRVVTSIFVGHQSSYQPFVDDNVNYKILTQPLDAAGKASFPGDAGMIDHITISNDMVNEYIPNSTDIEDARAYIPNYNATTASDHLPVFSRYEFCKLTCPGSISVPNEANQCGATVNFNISSTMACGTVTAEPAPGSFFPVGETTVNVTASTGETCSFTLTVTDDENPTITAPVDVNANNDPGKCYATVLTLGTPVTSDNCGVQSITNNAPANGQFPIGSTTVIWTVTDTHGHSATAAQTITVTDNENPTIICAGNQNRSTNSNVCSYTVSGAEFNATAIDNCSGVTISNDYNNSNTLAGAVFHAGQTTVVWTATDAAGNTSSCSSIITVEDHQAPSITAPSGINVTPNHSGCTAINVVLGSPTTSDNCSGVTFTNNAPAVYPLGTTVITWTATDVSGNSATAAQNVTVAVNPTVMSSINDEYAVNPGGAANTIYIGYGPPSVTLHGNASGGGGSYSYKWTIGSSAGPPLNSTSSFTVSPTTTTTYYFNVKDQFGCSAPLVTKTINVVDVRCGPKNDKVTICELVKGKQTTSCISSNNVGAALAAGARLGPCTNSITQANVNAETSLTLLTVAAAPNPSGNYFTISIKGGGSEKVRLRVTDMLGRIIEQKENLHANSTITIGDHYYPGVYIVEAMQGNIHKQIKLIKAN